MKKLNIAFVSGEVAPFSKTGGLGDVLYALPKAINNIKKAVGKIVVFTPLYGCIDRKKYPMEDVRKDIKIKFNGKIYTFSLQKHQLEGIDVFFINHYEFFGRRRKLYMYRDDNIRFMLFDLAVIESLKFLYRSQKFLADVIHLHDWHSGLIPNYLKIKYKNSKIFKNCALVYTIHNLAFQGRFNHWHVAKKNKDKGEGLPPTAPRKIHWINFVRRAIKYADIISTVSENYAKEIVTPEFGEGLHHILKRREQEKRLFGIINGVDYDVFNPALDKNLVVNYDIGSIHKKKDNKLVLQKEFHLPRNPKIPIIGIASRITEQKGFDLIKKIINHLVKMNLQIVIVGSGDKYYRRYLERWSRRYPKVIGAHLRFSEKIASRIYAGADMFLMPSRYEPCGLGQMISLRYGTIPIVRDTGGLTDTITNFSPITKKGNGFVFKTYDETKLLIAIVRAIETYKNKNLWEHLQRKAMHESFSWKLPAQGYLRLYRRAIKINREKKL